MSVLGIRQSTAKLLLSRTRPAWDVEKVVEAWYDEDMRARLLGNQAIGGESGTTCQICGADGDEVFYSLSCGHVVCTECVSNFLQSSIHPSDGSPPVPPPYTCKQFGGCADGVLEVEVASLPLDEDDKALISLAEATIESGYARECEACGKLNRPVTGRVNVRCQCGAHYCFACGREA